MAKTAAERQVIADLRSEVDVSKIESDDAWARMQALYTDPTTPSSAFEPARFAASVLLQRHERALDAWLEAATGKPA